MKKLHLGHLITSCGLCFLVVAGFLVFSASCTPPEKLRKQAVFFNEGLDTALFNRYQLVEPVIQKGDLLQITISSRSSSANQLFNQNYSNSVSSDDKTNTVASTGSTNGAGYLVDISTGDIKLPLLGSIHADGMTKLALERDVIKRATEYLREDPIVNIRYLNFRVTFHGFVSSPGTKIFSSERVTFLEALGNAGGTAQGADLKKVLIIREQNDKRTMSTIDLTNGKFFNSEFYYLKQNDIVVVPPSDRYLKNADQSAARTLQYVSFGLNILNVVIILLTFFR